MLEAIPVLLKPHSGSQGMNRRAWAAAMVFWSGMARARRSGTPRKMPGKPRALMT